MGSCESPTVNFARKEVASAHAVLLEEQYLTPLKSPIRCVLYCLVSPVPVPAWHCAMLKEYLRHSSDILSSTRGSQVCRATVWKAQVPAPLVFDADAVGTVSRCLKAVEVESAA